MVAGAVERRVWSNVGFTAGEPRQTFPNLFVFLVGTPAVGKSVIDRVRRLWNLTERHGGIKAFHVAPKNMSKAAMMDRLNKALQDILPMDGPPFEYHSLLVAAEEVNVLLPAYDPAFIGTLIELYNCPDDISESRRYSPNKDLEINFPVLNLLVGVQPAWLAMVFPAEAWNTGMSSRTIMIYSSAGPAINPFEEGRNYESVRKMLLGSLRGLRELHGEVIWTEEAKRLIGDWWTGGAEPKPMHSKLEHYNARRNLHALKLSMISAISRTHGYGPVEIPDVERAINWMVEAEKAMPDIFRAMIGKSDVDTLEELYRFAVSYYGLKKKAIQFKVLMNWLSKHTTADKIRYMFAAAQDSGRIERVGETDLYMPKARTEWDDF